MRCPACNSTQTKVVDSRLRERINTVYRRRRCIDCGHGWQTNEIDIVELEMLRTVLHFRRQMMEFAEAAATAVASVNQLLTHQPGPSADAASATPALSEPPASAGGQLSQREDHYAN